MRSANPGILLRTDLIVGFPTETPEELEESIAYVARCFDEVAIYAYEPKAGTPIASAGVRPPAPEEVHQRRAHASDRLKRAGLLVHSGGQLVSTLRSSDMLKEARRQEGGGTPVKSRDQKSQSGSDLDQFGAIVELFEDEPIDLIEKIEAFGKLNAQIFPGETQAVNDVIGLNNLEICRFEFDSYVSFAVLK